MAYTVTFTTPTANKSRITAEVKEDGTAINIPALGYTRAVVKIAGVLLDSRVFPDVFDWDDGALGKITFDITDFPHLTGAQKVTLSFFTAASFTAVTVVEAGDITVSADTAGFRGAYANHLAMQLASAIPGCGADMIALPDNDGAVTTLADYITQPPTYAATNIDAGASGTAGTVDVYPATASRGKLQLTCANQTGNTTVTLVADAMGQATTVHIPDPGGTSYLVQSTAALTRAEADFLDGATSANTTASKAVIQDAAKCIRTNANCGTPNTGVTAVEYGDGRIHQTVLTIAKTDAIDIADDAALADGYKIYDFPAGSVIINGTYMTAGVTVASTESQAVNADLGLGTTVASGANNVLSANAAFENVLTGQTTAGCTGTAAVKTVGTQLVIEAGDSHSLFLNVAATWANDTGGDLTGDFAGTVVVNWVFNA